MLDFDDSARAERAWGSRWFFDTPNVADGLDLMSVIPDGSVAAAFFDPQYRGGLDKLGYGNEGDNRGRERHALQAMDSETIGRFVAEITRCLRPSGHLFLWLDKFEALNSPQRWFGEDLHLVDMLTWDKGRIGMGYRSRRCSEHIIVGQKSPKRAKGVWCDHSIPDVWREKAPPSKHTHAKPIALQQRLIEAVSSEGDIILDPCAGSFGVMLAANRAGRRFFGGDIKDWRGA